MSKFCYNHRPANANINVLQSMLNNQACYYEISCTKFLIFFVLIFVIAVYIYLLRNGYIVTLLFLLCIDNARVHNGGLLGNVVSCSI